MKSKARRLTALLLVVLLLAASLPYQTLAAAAWDGQSASEPAADGGVYQIGTAEELYWFALQVNGGTAQNAVLTDDIDLNEQTFPAIGTTSYPFEGVFDGQGYTVRKLKLQSTAAYKGALFGKNQGVIQNLGVSGEISGTGNGMAGIVGWNAGGTVSGCKSAVTILNTKSSARYIGGVVGWNSLGGRVENCIFTGSLTAASTIGSGGVAGCNTSSVVAGCVNQGEVSGTSSYAATVGGVVGRWELSGRDSDTAVYNCYNLGTVTGGHENAKAGGIVGLGNATSSQSGSKFTLLNCYNAGKVTGGQTDGLIAAKPNSDYAALQFENNYTLGDATDYASGTVCDEDLLSAAFADRLNRNDGSAFGLTVDAAQRYVKGDAYPLLVWQAGNDPEPPVVPVVSVSISGTPKEGETLSATPFGAEDAAATGVAYQWQLSAADEAYADIPGATAQTFTIPDDGSYAGKYILVIAYGEEESSAVSAPIGPIDKTDAAAVAADREALILAAPGVIREAMTIDLPTAGREGSFIVWSSSLPSVIDPATGAVTLPAEGIADVTLTANLEKGSVKDTKTFSFRVYSLAATATEEAQTYLERAKEALENSWYHLRPVYGRDTNVAAFVQERLDDLGYTGITVAVKESADTRYVAQDGTITYFYDDPNTFRAMWFASVGVTFTFQKDGAGVEHSKNAVIYWDQDQARQTMQSEIADKVTETIVRADNESLDKVYTDLVLPRVVDNKKWSLISWESSDPEVIRIDDSNQSTADTLFDPYIGRVKQGETDQTVTLTATFRFQLANTTGGEGEILLQKTFDVTVKAIGSDLRERMQALLDQHYTADKLTVSGTGAALDTAQVSTDIQFPIPKNTGVPDYMHYTFAVESGDSDALTVSGYRGNVYRPLPGQPAKTVTLTVSMSHKEYNMTVTRELTVTLLPLTQEEIDREIRLMEAVKAAYFDGINDGANPDAAHIENNLHAFKEARFVEDGSLRWIYAVSDATGTGIIPVSIDLSHPSEQWDRFRSSAPQIVSHENLLVTKPEYDKAVTITSCLSSETFERYAEKYPDRADFQKLSRQEVTASLTVLGEKGTGGEEPEQLSLTFSLIGDQAHGAGGHAAYAPWLDSLPVTLENGRTVAELLQAVLTANGYAFEGSGYIRSVTTPEGYRLAEREHGANSGWMYAVNNLLGETYADQYYPADGDEIVWFYTDDPAKDPRIDGKKVDFTKQEQPDNPDKPDIPTPSGPDDPNKPDVGSQWHGFRGAGNQGITDAKTPRTAAEAELKWTAALKDAEDWTTYLSQPLLIDGQVYIVVGDELLVLNQKGDLLKSTRLADSIDSTCRPVYAEGIIVLPITGGRMQAVSADTLASRWITDPPTEKPSACQSLSTVTYSDGRVFMGVYASGGRGAYVCVDIQTGEIVWQYNSEGEGYYWSGAVHTKSAAVFAGEDGILRSVNPETGSPLDTLDLGASVRSTPVLEGNYIYLTTTDGRLHKVELQADGSFGEKSGVRFAASSTGTAAVYDGVAYVGGRLEDGTGLLALVDAASMEHIRTVSAPADVKSAPLVSIGYDGAVYIYFTANTPPGSLYVYKTGEQEAQELFTPAGSAANYCIASPVAGANGTLYYTNDSGVLFAAGGEAAALTYTVTIQCGQGGSVSPSGRVTVAKGESLRVEITPEEGYEVEQVLLGGESVSVEDGGYTLRNITADQVLAVSFVKQAGQKPDTGSDTSADTNTDINTNTNHPDTDREYPIAPAGANPKTGEAGPAVSVICLLLAVSALFGVQKNVRKKNI